MSIYIVYKVELNFLQCPNESSCILKEQILPEGLERTITASRYIYDSICLNFNVQYGKCLGVYCVYDGGLCLNTFSYGLIPIVTENT